jgi:glycosyltransferase involved in cell wall biosynthesis
VHIAIVIPAFNVAPYLQHAIASVLRQTHANWSLVVVDDGSTDPTAAVAAGFQDSRIRLLRQPNAGVSAARNAGIAAALEAAVRFGTGEAGGRSVPDAVLFLDGDDWLTPTALAVLAATLDAAPWAAAACGRFARVGLDGAIHPSRSPPSGSLLECLLIRNLFANGGHVLIRRQAVQAAGGFRTDLRYGEDWEYWTRLALAGKFASVRRSAPLLFVRERPGSACLAHATDPQAYRPAIEAIYRNPAIAARVGRVRLAALARRAEAEIFWTVGRELLRHGRRRDGLRWLGRSIRHAPSLKRLLLAGLTLIRVPWTGF